MAGYSGKPLIGKLGLKEGQQMALHHAPECFVNLLAPFPAAATLYPQRQAGCDLLLAFYIRQADLSRDFPDLLTDLSPGGMLWIAWPKKASGVATDIREDGVRAAGLPHGWVDVKVCAIDETWSGLKFLRRKT
ncbi:DUF3052 domain-containing protein [Leeia sp. IMCC25680]|uniref:DUF3052 domain-containing protein n=2 Tax=Leeia aquatica TaxID=2725557 RepID=A0A847S4M4_9NEIS|nr:DUF3052 domain-containing protein [Leeia aquatica]